ALGVTTAQMGLLIFGMAIGSILGLVLSSHLIARFDARRVMGSCLAAAAVGLAVAGLGVTLGAGFWVVFAALALFGAGTSTCDVAMNLSGAVNERALGHTIMPVF